MLEHEITFDLLEAQEVLTKFIDNKANITAIATAATIMAKAINVITSYSIHYTKLYDRNWMA